MGPTVCCADRPDASEAGAGRELRMCGPLTLEGDRAKGEQLPHDRGQVTCKSDYKISWTGGSYTGSQMCCLKLLVFLTINKNSLILME